MLWKPSENMSSSPEFAERMVHLALQRRKTSLKIDKLLLVSYICPARYRQLGQCCREGSLRHISFMFVEFWGTWSPWDIKHLYTECIIIMFMCFVLISDKKEERSEGRREEEGKGEKERESRRRKAGREGAKGEKEKEKMSCNLSALG